MRSGGPQLAGQGHAFHAFEDAAVEALVRRGYRVLARNYRIAGGEIDVIACDGPTLCFVEVRARRSARFGAPEETVGRSKQTRLRLAAEQYLSVHPQPSGCRFDVVAISHHEIRLIKDAF
ncbi:MAG TPA: YraN family protein [Haliangiales bacterium]|nr:YraN family protein [Haliangiales bacterium]